MIVTRTVTDGVASYTERETTIADYVMIPITGALGVFSSAEPTTFVSEKTVGVSSLLAIAAGVVVGDRWGDSIPLLGGRR